MKNTFVKVLSFVMALMMVVGTFGTLAVFAADCTHANAEHIVVAPTCKSIGYTKNVCPDCGEEWISNPVDKIANHDYSVYVPAKPADCETPAMTDGYECSICHEADPEREATRVEGSVAKGHVFHAKVVVDATCTTDGYTTMKCARCNFVDHEGKFCAKCGMKTANCTCKVCDTCEKTADKCECVLEEGEEITLVAKPTATKTNPTAKGHKLVYTTIDEANASKCESGLVRVTCSVCDYTYDLVETNNHDWEEIKGADIDRDKDPFKNVPEVGTTCDYTYKNGEYCTICGKTQKMQANDVSNHNTVATHTGDTTLKSYLGATIPANKVTAEILAMSWNGVAFGAGTATTKTSDCNEKGYNILYCNDCKKFVLEIVDEKACAVDGDEGATSVVGAWKTADGETADIADDIKDDIAEINKTKYHCVALTRTTTCTKCGEIVKTETKAAEAHLYDWKDEDDVQKGTVVTPKTCEANGQTAYDCKFCDDGDYVTVEATDIAKDHVWSTTFTYAADFDCTDDSTWTNALIYTCTYENCSADDPDTADVKEKATKEENYTNSEKKHDYEKKTQAATCVADAAYYNECKRCHDIAKFGEENGPTDKPAAGFDAKNHVVTKTTTNLSKLDEPLEEGADATCTTAKINKYLCACGEQIYVEMEAAKGHNKTGVFTDRDYDGKVDANEIDAPKFDGNCQKKAVAQGKYCTACITGKEYNDYVITETSAIGTLKADVHADDAPVFVETVAPTCSAKGYTEYYYKCCGDILKVNYTEIVADAHNPEYVAEVSATCSAAGKAEHFACEYCDVVFAAEWEEGASEAKVGDIIEDLSTLVIPQMKDADGNPGHKWGEVIAEDPEECDKDGKKAHQICENCGMYLIEGKVYELTYKDNDPSKEETVVSAALKIPAHKTKYMGFHKDVPASCTTKGYDYPTTYSCSKCDVTEIPATEHKNTVSTDKNGEFTDGAWTAIEDCTKDCYTEKICPDCGLKSMDNFQKASETAHKYKDDEGEWINEAVWTWIEENPAKHFACLSGKTSTHKCANCDVVTAGETVDVISHYDMVNDAKVEFSFACNEYTKYLGLCCDACGVTVTKENAVHTPVESIKVANCTEDGHIITYCANNCDFFIPETPDEYTKKTDHAGTKVEIARTPATTTAPGSVTYSCSACVTTWTETLKQLEAPATFTVTTNVASAVAGTDVTVTIEIAAEALSFNVLELVLSADNFVANDDAVAAGFDTDVEVIVGETIQIYPSVTTETVTLGDDKKATITFTATLDLVAFGKCEIEVDEASAYTYGDNNATNVTELTLADVKAAAVNVSVIGNVNGDTIFGVPAINAADYKETFNYAKAVATGAAAYDEKYDINRDNIVNTADAMAIRTFIRSEQTVADYLAMLGFGIDDVVADIVESKSIRDMDGDGDRDLEDATQMAESYWSMVDSISFRDIFAE